MKLCNYRLSELSQSVAKQAGQAQLIEFDNSICSLNYKQIPSLNEKSQHRKLVLAMIEIYLRQVCHMYSELKAVRFKSSVERKQCGRLETSTKSSRSRSSVNGFVNHVASSEQNIETPSSQLAGGDEDVQQLEMENDLLWNELQGMDDQVRVIEGQVVEISRLQSIFTEKVLAQSEQIDNVHMSSINSTENIKQGNEHVRDAIRNNAGLRFWILFFLVVTSFSLLFLDWYDT